MTQSESWNRRRRAEQPDPLTPAQRRLNMQRVRAHDTKPELLLRRALHAFGYRYRLHDVRLPGKPDLVLKRWRAVIRVQGCFWHGHDCSLGVWPRTNAEFWEKKITANRARDALQEEALVQAGWRVATVWQCALTGRQRVGVRRVAELLHDWLQSGALTLELNQDSNKSGDPS